MAKKVPRVQKIYVYLEAILFACLVITSTYVVVHTYNIKGVGWDFVDQYLSGYSILQPGISHALLNWPGHTNLLDTGSYYFAIQREPLNILLMAATILFAGYRNIIAYLIFLMIITCVSILFISKQIKINPLLIGSLILSTYLVQYAFLFNSSEALSIAILLFTIPLLIENSALSGVSLGLLSLIKYPNLIFLPMLLFLPKDKRNKAILLFSITILPWLLFNYIVTGNPIFSYLQIISQITSSSFVQAPISWYLSAIALPVLSLAISITLLVAYSRNTKNGLAQLFNDEKTKKLVLILALGFIGFIILYKTINNGALRFVYLVYVPITVLSCYMLKTAWEQKDTRTFNYTKALPCILAMISIVAMISYMHWALNPTDNWMNIFSNQSSFTHAASKIQSLGMSNCTIVTNVWPYMWYLGINAYPSLYYYQVGYNRSIAKYPILLISNAGGVPNNLTILSNISMEYEINSTITIYLPKNTICK